MLNRRHEEEMEELEDHHQLLLVRLAILVSFLVCACAWQPNADHARIEQLSSF